MTRINCSIPVKNLTDEHLLAEHREIKRLPSCLEKAIKSGSINNIQDQFSLGKGHVLFFLDKMAFIKCRYVEIYNECIRRNLNVQSYINNFDDIPSQYNNEYYPNSYSLSLLIDRITTRILEGRKQHYHYYRKTIGKDEAISLLKSLRSC